MARKYVARESFACEIDGERIMVRKGRTRVDGEHPLYKAHSKSFEPVDKGVEFDVEQATKAPGEKRGVSVKAKSSTVATRD